MSIIQISLEKMNLMEISNLLCTPTNTVVIIIGIYDDFATKLTTQFQRAISLSWRFKFLKYKFLNAHRQKNYYYLPSYETKCCFSTDLSNRKNE